MAMSNRDRIGKMLEVLSPPLDAFITDCVGPELPEGKDWTILFAALDGRDGRGGPPLSRTDPQLIFRMLADDITHKVKPGWRPFKKRLSRVHQTYAVELRDARNTWAHGGSFTADDAYRVLDTAERLLQGVDGPDEAAQIKNLRLELRRVTADQDDRRTLRTASAANPESTGLKPWREVLRPHHDVATGNLQAAEFAADLFKVAQGDGDVAADYADPVQFFARTYLTEGLTDLITRAVRRLGGDDNAVPVINLQTNFGGGKTHSMLSLWHLAAGRPLAEFPQALQDLLADSPYDDLTEREVHRVALVGTHLGPGGDLKADGTRVNTIWGELAWQLGGREAYDIVRSADESATNPGAALHELLAAYSPTVILIDEWVAYARQLHGRDNLAGGTFDTQFTFAQALTEAAKATPGVLVAISIPASDRGDGEELVPGSAEEVGGEYGLEALSRLQNVVRRVADQWRPASSNEAYHIVRQRLFETPTASALAEISRTAREFGDLYRREPGNFPREARDEGYEQRIKESYPIHPELFDRLYQEWSTLERFQRTRGVLQLMSTIVHALWKDGVASPLILPGSIPMDSSSVNSQLMQYLPDQWKAVVSSDVDGPQSQPVEIDTKNPLYGQRSTTRRLARTVFFGAAPTIGSALKGVETERVFLGTAIPGDVVGNFHGALSQLADNATYFYSGSGKYWYDTQANINRRARDQAERLHEEDVWAEIRRRLAGQSAMRGEFARVHVCPADGGDVPDVDEAALVLLPPRVTHDKGKSSSARELAQQMTDNCGTSHRANRNMVVFLAADEKRMVELDNAVRTYLGWNDVYDKSAELDLTQSQHQQAKEQMDRADQTSTDRLLGTYLWILRPDQPDGGAGHLIAETKVETQAPSLAERVSRKLGSEGQLATRTSAGNIALALRGVLKAMWDKGDVSVGQLWEVYARYPYMQRLRDRSVLVDGLVYGHGIAWQAETFALAEAFDGERYVGLWLPGDLDEPLITDETLLVHPKVAVEQRERDVVRSDPGPAPGPEPVPPRPGPPVDPPTVVRTRFYGARELGSDTYASELKKIYDEILSHLEKTGRLSLRLEIEAEAPDGFDDHVVRVVSENASTLKFEQSGFEEG